MSNSRLHRLRRRGANESGVVAVLVAIMLVVFLGMAAFAIDLSSFWKAQRQAQSAADAGALAAADTMTGGSTTSVNSVATNYATTNYPGSSVTVTQPTSTSVKVTVNAQTASIFGTIFGRTGAQVTAAATAKVIATSTACATNGVDCYAIFAKDSSCSGTGVSFSGGGYHISGGIHSNGPIDTGGGGSSFGPTTYGTGCTATTGGGDSFTSGPTAEAPVTTWPIDYSQQFPACSGGSCTGPLGTPSYCTFASSSNYTFTSSPANGIYCDYGSGTPSNPATYTGAVSFNGGGYGCSGAMPMASFIAGSISSGAGSICDEAYNYPTNHLIFYAVGAGSSGNPTINLGGGSNTWDGDFFCPNGTIQIAAGSEEFNFLEGQDVKITAGGITGDGPSDASGGSTSTTSSASLVQ